MRKIFFIFTFLVCTGLAFGQSCDVGLDIGTFLRSLNSADRNDTLVVRGTWDLQYTNGAFTNDVDSLALVLYNTDLCVAEVDSIISNIEAKNDENGFIDITGTNGYASTSASADLTALSTDGWDVFNNGVPLTAFDYSNDGQSFQVNTAITAMSAQITTDDGSSATGSLYFQQWGLPTGLSMSSSTGQITGTYAGAADTFEVAVRAHAFDDYTGYRDTTFALQFTGSSTTRHLINFSAASGGTDETEDPGGAYWNNVESATADLTNIVDEDNNATTIDITTNSGFAGENNTQGRSPSDGVYPNNAWDSYVYCAPGPATITIGGLDNAKTYDITIGASRNTSATDRVGEYYVGGTPQTLDAALNPPETITFSGVSPASNAITLSFEVQSSPLSSFAYISFIELIENN